MTGAPSCQRPLRVAIRPLADDNNRFLARFSSAAAQAGAEVSDYVPTLRALIRSDIAILHWPNEFLGPAGRQEAFVHLAKLRLARLFGTRLVWVAHNLGTHDGDSAHRIVPESFIASLDGVIYLSEVSRTLVRARYAVPARAAELVTVHGRYEELSPASAFAPPAADEPVQIVNAGQIRPYKNLDELVTAAAALDNDVIRLTLTGRVIDHDHAAQISTMAAGHSHIVTNFRDAYLTDLEMEHLIDANHGVALPYRSILNSGSALLALSRNRPVLVPAIGSMPELRDAVGAEWVMLYEGTLDAGHLRAFADFVRCAQRPGTPDLSGFAWPRVSSDLKRFFTQLLPGG